MSFMTLDLLIFGSILLIARMRDVEITSNMILEDQVPLKVKDSILMFNLELENWLVNSVKIKFSLEILKLKIKNLLKFLKKEDKFLQM